RGSAGRQTGHRPTRRSGPRRSRRTSRAGASAHGTGPRPRRGPTEVRPPSTCPGGLWYPRRSACQGRTTPRRRASAACHYRSAERLGATGLPLRSGPGQRGLDGGGDLGRVRLDLARPAGDELAVLADEPLVEVPLHVTRELGLRGEPGEERVL